MHKKAHPTNLPNGPLYTNCMHNKKFTVDNIFRNVYVDIFDICDICETKCDHKFPEGQYHVTNYIHYCKTVNIMMVAWLCRFHAKDIFLNIKIRINDGFDSGPKMSTLWPAITHFLQSAGWPRTPRIISGGPCHVTTQFDHDINLISAAYLSVINPIELREILSNVALILRCDQIIFWSNGHINKRNFQCI